MDALDTVNGKATKTRLTDPIGPTETIRHRLQLSEGAFGQALGYAGDGRGYNAAKATGRVARTVALAAEALMRRQAAVEPGREQLLLIATVKGAPLIYDVTEIVREMVLDGETFYLVPKGR